MEGRERKTMGAPLRGRTEPLQPVGRDGGREVASQRPLSAEVLGLLWPSPEKNGRGLGSDVREARGSFSGRRVEAARATAPWKRKRGWLEREAWGDDRPRATGGGSVSGWRKAASQAGGALFPFTQAAACGSARCPESCQSLGDQRRAGGQRRAARQLCL